MGIRGKTPGRGDGIGTWSHDKVPAGSERYGWIAGDVHVFTCHSSRASKPCRRHYCGEMHDCVGCVTGIPVKPLGFVPLWRWDGKPTVIIIQEHHFEHVGMMGLHDRVIWGREKGHGEGVWVKTHPIQTKWETTIPAKRMPVDIVWACCVLFGMPDMERVLRDSLRTSDNPLSLTEPVTPKEAKRQIDAIKAEAGDRITNVVKRSFVVKEADPAPLSELLPNLDRHRRNGKT